MNNKVDNSGGDKDNTESTKKRIGEINLVRLFQAEALDLMTAVERGRLLHKTLNIRASGSPLEERFRSFLAGRLPSQFGVLNGYLFDVNSVCTPQIDAMLVNTRDCHAMMEAEGEARYVPFTAALAVVELKNSASSAAAALDQLMKIKASIKEMIAGLRMRRQERGHSSGPTLVDPISVMFFAESKDLKLSELKNWYSENKKEHPTYTVLLDRELIITDRNIVNQFLIFESETVGFYDHRSPDEPYFCVPKVRDEYGQGRTLLWLYFALMAMANLAAEGNQRPIIEFTNDAVQTYALAPVAAVNQVTDWDDLEMR